VNECQIMAARPLTLFASASSRPRHLLRMFGRCGASSGLPWNATFGMAR
jgi:hypothetical protein